ncbi:hypothetical protein HRG_010833 [Hirsutella rhossiliensis]|uniref:Uncharacterized protein n=1 Tax=Hirsutella rhossiliensis TaxID=111463 RepID=A0A9P8MKT3_9HYPO|nr:uncharacterized protein HRG_10833 [Hirsutella rhossiliensis]KAH0958138.1 hypothetical protein HRG_10833 [Hirsutella rhossiliensis]
MKSSVIISALAVCLHGTSAQLVDSRQALLERVKDHIHGLCHVPPEHEREPANLKKEQTCLCADLSKDGKGLDFFGIASAVALAQNVNNQGWDRYFVDFGKEYCSVANPTESFRQMDIRLQQRH